MFKTFKPDVYLTDILQISNKQEAVRKLNAGCSNY